jgi:hypothetical protein
VYSNQAVLRLEGDDGNDLFTVRAFALADTVGGTENATKTYTSGGQTLTATYHNGIWWQTYDPTNAANDVALPALTSGFSTAAETDIRTGGGNNQVQYNINAPVSIDGGNGFDKVVVLGTEYADHIVITDTAIYGAGLAVTYQNIEAIEVDGLEGNDSFDVLSTPPGVEVRVIGGLGSDTINVGSDVVGTVFAEGVEGASGAINHLVTSLDTRYNGLVTDGIDLTVAQPDQGVLIINETGGSTAVTEGGSTDSYTIALQHAPTTDVYVTVSAGLAPQELTGADSILVSTNSNFYRPVTDNYAPGSQPVQVPQRSIVLHWAKGETEAQTVFVWAPHDGVAEGDRTVVISHTIISADPTFDDKPARFVEVNVHDIDQPGINLIPIDPTTGLPDNQSLVLEGTPPYGINDQYLLHLAIPPTDGTVAIDIAPGDPRVEVSSADPRFSVVTPWTSTSPGLYRVIFNPSTSGSKDVLITISAFNDYQAQDPHTTVITHSVNLTTPGLTTDSVYSNPTSGATPQSLYVKVLDNDSAGVVVLPSNGSTVVSAGPPAVSDTYTLRLTGEPTAPVNIDIITDGLTNIATGGGVNLAAIGTPGHGLYTGSVIWDSTSYTLTRTDGSSWLDSGFLEGQLVRFNGDTSGDTYKIQLIHGTTSTKLDQLTLTPVGTPPLSAGPATVTVTEWAPQVTFTGGPTGNWYQPATVTVSADPNFSLAVGRENEKHDQCQPFARARHCPAQGDQRTVLRHSATTFGGHPD